MDQIFAFLNDLARNNTREWFTENKGRYQESLEQFREMATSLIAGISSFDPTLDGIDAKQSIFRIYKDVRFSKDKSPYKTHFGCWMTKGGRKSTDAGYYFHLEPGKSFAAAGVWMPPAEQLKLIRQEILYNPEAYFKIINDPLLQKKYERDGTEDKLKRGPAGFPQDSPHIDELKYKHHIFSRHYKDPELNNSKVSSLLADDFRGLYPLVNYLNHAMSFTGNH
ncbi:MAG: DUF2461 domain-containing protein [Bacteroidetes bacterium]|nr:DUF2461 domain-containing protein [Bacteroidota bacterium]